jgi:RHS repeat-associated protein
MRRLYVMNELRCRGPWCSPFEKREGGAARCDRTRGKRPTAALAEDRAETEAGATDAAQNPVSEFAPAGTLANTYIYDSFGKLNGFTGTLTNPFQFTGREFDSETGIYEYRYRYYDPNAGRFVSEDPIGFRAGIDFYEYVFNNPLLWTDPRGLEVQMCTKNWHPHTFLCVNGDCSGKYPSGNPFWSPGQIQNDSSNKSKAHCGAVPNSNTPCFEQCVTNYIRQRGPSNDIYSFMSANCGQWADDVVTVCRIKCSK